MNVPYSGLGSSDYKIGIVTEIVSERVLSIAPVSVSCACRGRVATWNMYHSRFVDFSTREIRASFVAGRLYQ